MKIIVSCTDAQKEELTIKGVLPEVEVIYIKNNKEQNLPPADAFMDLQFENAPEQIRLLEEMSERLIIVNSVTSTLPEIRSSFIRINAWPTFLSSDLIEAATLDNEKKILAQEVFKVFNKKIEWVPDVPGFITPRIISMIINEAFFALSECVSTKEEIDTAMKLGTNYPYGPFEWAQKIGLNHIMILLNHLSKHQSRYTPCSKLLEEFQETHLPVSNLTP
ncbi:3-hydroxyacyl-CoA dehydrogenase family protein [Chitinophagaceae bacterium LB-8]|uniref:3-hydroxyacyl-CoA dehydrogenase family protein n=1 Tax=Paraflavisolibacter caeni TaxID=2982496 RepID=A0A9X2XPS3_9BACT|nr:3-hydroxyacyl-CoA dehydrogenase family protein [Paraflavisolibacter caeni]MCU7552058.1 3-hydroxyacyl-CoA dehydrogenase family protein [Paraflavisolibacter caeni]